MGNGLLGTDMYKAETPDTYRINVGRSDITEQRSGYDLYGKGRLPIGYGSPGTIPFHRRWLLPINMKPATSLLPYTHNPPGRNVFAASYGISRVSCQ